MDNDFRATLRPTGGLAVIDLRGDIASVAAEPALSSAYAEATADGARTVLLNFRDVGYINSTGIALIVGLLTRARLDGRALTAFGLGAHYVEIFQITRLADFIRIMPDEQTALAGARSGS